MKTDQIYSIIENGLQHIKSNVRQKKVSVSFMTSMKEKKTSPCISKAF